jgi:hypothetical protein
MVHLKKYLSVFSCFRSWHILPMETNPLVWRYNNDMPEI